MQVIFTSTAPALAFLYLCPTLLKPPTKPNRFCSDPKIHTFARVGRQMSGACNHTQNPKPACFSLTLTLFFPLYQTQTLCSPHTHTHSHTQASGLVCYFIFYVCLKINSPKLPLRPPFLWLL